MRILLLLLSLFTPAAAETHFYFKMPLFASRLNQFNLPSAEGARDVLMVNVRLISPDAFRIRIFYTCKLPDGTEKTYERDVRVRDGDLWATAAFDEEQILDSEFVRIRFKEEAEPPALVESTMEAPKPQ